MLLEESLYKLAFGGDHLLRKCFYLYTISMNYWSREVESFLHIIIILFSCYACYSLITMFSIFCHVALSMVSTVML